MRNSRGGGSFLGIWGLKSILFTYYYAPFQQFLGVLREIFDILGASCL